MAREAGFTPQTMDGYLKGAMPSADRALKLAAVMEVDVRWLVLGEGEARPKASEPGADTVTLPKYDLRDFSEHGKPAPDEEVEVRRDLLGRWGSTRNLWLAELPFDSEVAQEGEVVLCRDPEPQLADGKVYAIMLDGRLTVRRVQLRPNGLVLKSGADEDAIVLGADQLEHFMPIARILAAVSPQPV